MQEYLKLIQAAWPHADTTDLAAFEPGIHQVPGRVTLSVTDHYFRAIAKIGFHYYLTHSRRGFRGDEECFAPLRKFILNGGDHERFFRRSGPTFKMPFGDLPFGGVVTPNQWCHVLAATEVGREVVVYVQLFVGPGCVTHPFYIRLASIPPLFLDDLVWAHIYLYDNPQQPGDQAGQVVVASITKLR